MAASSHMRVRVAGNAPTGRASASIHGKASSVHAPSVQPHRAQAADCMAAWAASDRSGCRIHSASDDCGISQAMHSQSAATNAGNHGDFSANRPTGPSLRDRDRLNAWTRRTKHEHHRAQQRGCDEYRRVGV